VNKKTDISLSGAGIQIVHSAYVDLMRQRALGNLPDMGCAIRLCEIIKELIISNSNKGKIGRLLDVGCATGHYLKTLQNKGIPIEKYIGLEIDARMIVAGKEVWEKEIKTGLVEFIQDDIESQQPLSKSDLLICFNSFMYYKNAKNVLKKFIESANTIFIRSYFSDSNYRILRGQSYENNDSVDVSEVEIFDEFGGMLSGDFWTIYSFTYIEKILKEIEPKAKVTWIKDENLPDSINAELAKGVSKRGGTQIIGGYEISYPLLQPWEILKITIE